MPDLLLELLSEEIPARMQARAAEDFKKLITGALVDAGLVYDGAKAFVTPRRLALSVHGIPARSPDVKDERKGPKVGAPEQAIAGFVKAAGLKSISDAKVQQDKKGDFYVAVVERKGRPSAGVIKDVLHATIATFPWPKSMRWGSSVLKWVRPLHSIVATFGPETEEPEIIALDIDGIKAGNMTSGHRFMAPAPFAVKRLADYSDKLLKAKVVLDPERRKEIILHDARNTGFAQRLALVEDLGLTEELIGLVEWPVVLMGTFDEAFLSIPEEAIRATIRNNQKCFVLRDLKTSKLVNKFILVANEEASDGGKAIIAGNERVIRARLSDAKFFYETDLKTRLEDRLPKFTQIVFHEKLGTQADRIERIAALAKELAPLVKADPKLAERAARLCKMDLATEMVGEFPELQGLIGRYYAQAQGEDASVARAIEDHYKPQGPDDAVPADPLSIALALADKIDTLIGFWAIDEKPTGSKDPYALRRAALGVIRIALANKLNLHPRGLLEEHIGRVRPGISQSAISEIGDSFGAFVEDRLEIQLRNDGARHDLVKAVIDVGSKEAGLVSVVQRVAALGKFLDSDDGKNLLAGTKRAANIIRIEEKKDKKEYTGAPDAKLFKEPEEKSLAEAIATAKKDAATAVAKEDYASAMGALAKLRPRVDALFDKVTVNAEEPAVRENRLKLLNEIRAATRSVADFSRIEG